MNLLSDPIAVPESSCPNCGKVLNRLRSLTWETPAPNCITICIDCAAILALNADLTLRLATKREISAAEKHRDFLVLRSAIITLIQERRSQNAGHN